MIPSQPIALQENAPSYISYHWDSEKLTLECNPGTYLVQYCRQAKGRGAHNFVLAPRWEATVLCNSLCQGLPLLTPKDGPKSSPCAVSPVLGMHQASLTLKDA